MTLRTLLPLLPLTLLAGSADSPLAWSPPPGAELTAAHQVSWSLEFEEVSISVMGQDQDPADMIEDWDEQGLSRAIELAFAATDSELRLPLEGGDEGPEAFVREYSEFTLDGEVPANAEGLTEGARVRFRRDEDGGWTRTLLEPGEDGEGEPLDGLEALAEDLGFRRLVPGEAVEVDDSWRVYLSGQDLFDLVAGGLDAGGAPAIAAGLGLDDEGLELLLRLDEHLEALADGATVECTLVDVEQGEEGRDLARISLSFDHDGALELSEYFEDTVTFGDSNGSEVEPEVSGELEVSYEGTGELTWDLTAGCFAAFDLRVDFDAELNVDLTAQIDALSFEINAFLAWTGEIVHTAEGSVQ